MQGNSKQGRGLGSAPAWAEKTAPRGLLRHNTPSLIVISMPDGEEWFVASRAETEAIANPDSFVGDLLRPHCALLSLPYTSNN